MEDMNKDVMELFSVVSLQVIFLNDFYLSQLLEGNPRQSGGNGMTLIGQYSPYTVPLATPHSNRILVYIY